MIVIVDARLGSARAALVGKKSARWAEAADPLAALAKLRRTWTRSRPDAVVVFLPGAGEPMPVVSWSSSRAGVAAANALAFAWGVPVAVATFKGGETREELAELARRSVRGAKRGRWIRARYSGEPHITRAKVEVNGSKRPRL